MPMQAKLSLFRRATFSSFFCGCPRQAVLCCRQIAHGRIADRVGRSIRPLLWVSERLCGDIAEHRKVLIEAPDRGMALRSPLQSASLPKLVCLRLWYWAGWSCRCRSPRTDHILPMYAAWGLHRAAQESVVNILLPPDWKLPFHFPWDGDLSYCTIKVVQQRYNDISTPPNR